MQIPYNVGPQMLWQEARLYIIRSGTPAVPHYNIKLDVKAEWSLAPTLFAMLTGSSPVRPMYAISVPWSVVHTDTTKLHSTFHSD